MYESITHNYSFESNMSTNKQKYKLFIQYELQCRSFNIQELDVEAKQIM